MQSSQSGGSQEPGRRRRALRAPEVATRSLTLFRDPGQKADVCRILLARVDLAHVWGRRGPAPEASTAGPRASHDAKTMLSLCWAIWGNTAAPGFHEILSLAPENLRTLASLLQAVSNGPRAIDRWIEELGPA